MIFNTEKFHREIKQLPALSELNDPLTRDELLAIRRKVLRKIAAENPEAAPGGFIEARPTSRLIFRYAFLVLFGVFVVGGTAFASGSAIPGSMLYPVKRAVEKVQLNFTANKQSRAEMQATFARERIKELQKLSLRNVAAETVQISASETASGSAVVILAPATSTEEKKPDTAQRSKLERKARVEASQEIGNALEALKKVQTDLENKGNMEAAANIGDNILNLQYQARQQHLLDEGEDNPKGEPESRKLNKQDSQSAESDSQRRPRKQAGSHLNLDLQAQGQASAQVAGTSTNQSVSNPPQTQTGDDLQSGEKQGNN